MSLHSLVVRLSDCLVDDPPLSLVEGGMIRDGVDRKLDELRVIARGGREWIAAYQQEQIEKTGIPSLKVKYNRVFGFFIEITSTHLSKVPPEYERKQTTVSGERFTTPELKEYERRVLSADEEIATLEFRIFEELRTEIVAAASEIQKIAASIAEIDVLSGLAEASERRRWVRPEMVEGRGVLIKNGRHPVVEAICGSFVGNDTELSPEASFFVITGPNMAGKSTFLRQTALIVLLAQIGSFVPADLARIGIVDRIFTRIGSGDNLAAGESTFLTEMREVAEILHGATDCSLVILDEVGRGTSTFDGVALAWAIAEELATRGAFSLFATHYHELTRLSDALPTVKNASVAVAEGPSGVIFLHKIVPGGIDKSYGIEVARLAGLPQKLLVRAEMMLKNLETKGKSTNQLDLFSVSPMEGGGGWLDASVAPAPRRSALEEKLLALDPNSMTPIAALSLLAELKNEVL